MWTLSPATEPWTEVIFNTGIIVCLLVQDSEGIIFLFQKKMFYVQNEITIYNVSINFISNWYDMLEDTISDMHNVHHLFSFSVHRCVVSLILHSRKAEPLVNCCTQWVNMPSPSRSSRLCAALQGSIILTDFNWPYCLANLTLDCLTWTVRGYLTHHIRIQYHWCPLVMVILLI